MRLFATDGLFSIDVSCPPPPRPADVNCSGVRCCAGLRRGTHLAPNTKGFPASSPFASNGGFGANGRGCVAVVDCWAGCLDPNTNVFPLPPPAGGVHSIGGGPCVHVLSRPIVLGSFSLSAPKAACGDCCGHCSRVVRTTGSLGDCCGSDSCLFFFCNDRTGGGSAGGGGLCGISSFTFSDVVFIVVGVMLCYRAHNWVLYSHTGSIRSCLCILCHGLAGGGSAGGGGLYVIRSFILAGVVLLVVSIVSYHT